ncbi:mechanosensitive ion channel protein 10-like [Ricinus communis]|uniref:mechanosensitive ion channel protein 10-like n=1 Tax=Ricinus communis TaxID=3988 RepID=UPI000772A25F|nr:mechanosensitive ion channel protein 10-like [Ricinus communis]|eukprot:XP_015571819.1 mechanosensitive ion channel protein 10-like [Ricinus communis]
MAELIAKDFSINMQYVTQQAVHVQNPQSDSSVPQSTVSDQNDRRDTDPSFPDSATRRESQSTSTPDEAPSSGNRKTKTPEAKLSESPRKKAENGEQESEEKGKGWGLFMFIIFLESTVFVCVMGLLISSFAVDKLHDSVLWDLGIWKWCLLILAILCGRLIAYLLTEAMLFLIWMFWLDEKVLYFAYGVKKSVMFFIWLSLVTLAWGLLSTVGVKRSKDTTKILHDVTKGLGGCLIGAALWLLKTLLVKLVGSLHATKLFEKTQEAIRLRKDLLALSISNMAIQNSADRKKVENVSIRLRNLVRAISIADINDIDSEKQKVNKIAICQQKANKVLSKLGIRKTEGNVDIVSTKTMIELINAIRGKRLLPLTYIPTKNKDEMIKGEARTSLYSVANQKNIHDTKNKIAAAVTAAEEITDEARAKMAANDIFSTLAGSEDAGYVDLEKLLEFVKDEKVKDQFQGLAEDQQRKTETEKSNAEDKETAGHVQINTEQKQSETQSNTEGKYIKKSVFRNWVVDIYRDHDSLNNTLKHSKTAIDELNVIASVIVLVVIIVMWLLFMEFLNTKILLFLSSQLLLVVFMFGNTVKTVFEAVIFVFVVHPFDVGDRCVVQGVQMVVEEMNILTTTFLRYDGEKIYYPNSVLASKPLGNFYRSPPMMDTVEFAISLGTQMETIEKLQEKIKTYLENNPRRWRHDHSVQFKEIEDVNKMKVALYVNHTINFQNISKRGKRRSDLILEMKRIFEELKIEYHLLPQQVNLTSYVEPTSAQVPLPGNRSYFSA